MPHRRLLLAAPLGLAACGSLLPAQKYTPRTIWPLQPPPPEATAATGSGKVLLVRAITAAPGLEARGLQSLAADRSLNVDYYNLWAVPPAEALTQNLITWAQASGLFSAVITPGSRLTPGLMIEGELTQLLVDLPANTARAQMSLLVIKPSGSIGGFAQPLAQANLTANEPLQGSGPAAQADAQTKAMAGLLSQAVAQLARFAR
ncbi:MAG TPA: ABC-type transport auxiliary lipoprotein family protein [Acidocella sp.]|nr:ABC-type transport auxiliary lipoprotein family protein [Acidocella sp.]